MNPRTADMLGGGADEPLFPDMQTPWKKRAQRKPGIKTYAGPMVTCHACIIAVARGEALMFTRAPASWSVLLPSGREWLICSGHKDLMDSDQLKLED